MTTLSRTLLALRLLVSPLPAFGADLPASDLGPIKAPGLPLNWSVGLEVGPEFYAVTKGKNNVDFGLKHAFCAKTSQDRRPVGALDLWRADSVERT